MDFTAGGIIEWLLVREVFKRSSLDYRNPVYNLSFDCDVFDLKQLKVTDVHMCTDVYVYEIHNHKHW